MSEEYVDQVRRALMLQNETDCLNANKSAAVDLINHILRDYGIVETITTDDIEFTNQVLRDKMYPERSPACNDSTMRRKKILSDIVFKYYYPEPADTTFYHYTTFDSFSRIISSKQLRLFNLIKRFNEDEFRSFYLDHGLEGYEKRTDESGDLMSTSLMKEIFYTSFARSSSIGEDEEEYMWLNFGEDRCGVRMEFDIQTKDGYSDFRNVFYKGDDVPKAKLLLTKIASEVADRFNRVYVLSGVSKVGGFYLHEDFKTEHESRLLVKKNSEDYKFNFIIKHFAREVKYIEVNLDDNPLIDIHLVSVQPGKRCDADAARKIINKATWPNIVPSVVNP